MKLILCSAALLLTLQVVSSQNNQRELPTCQCFSFDPCVARERARFEQCSLRTCPSQVFDQLHQDWISCWNDSPQINSRFSACVEQQAGKSCTAFQARQKRQAQNGNYNNYNYYQQYQDADVTQQEEMSWAEMFQMLQGAADQWQNYGECISTCMNTTGTMREGELGPLRSCARQLNCKLQQWDWERLSAASKTCRQQLNIDWKAQIMNKCTCFERTETPQPACSDVQQVLNDAEGTGVEDLLDNVVAFFGYIMNNDGMKK
jgi:hypothetical protein